ncbi:hypothetical protein DNK47_01535 [Mycoplasma wenyonii]|uniref:Uncharacterized protein n=1 Tax=Mycoplasma wenyonii TaxID=65123 RepID=A0A328PTP4_9MOLU|nr:hypothetical protein DNK47_01535 [Mycoplasma wenyonii]
MSPEISAYSKLFELAKDYLTKLSYYENFINDVASQEPESLEFLSSSFSLLRELGSLSGNSSGIESLVSSFKSKITKGEKDFSPKQLDKLFFSPYKGEREWIDELSYIHIWTLNSYQLNLKTCSINDIKSSLNSPELELELREVKEQTQQAEQQFKKKKTSDFSKNGFAVYRNIFSSKFSFGDKDNGEYDDGFERIVSRTQAIERLERDIRGGKIYIYNTKPIRNLKLKKLLSYLFLAGLVVSCITFLKAFISCVSNNCQENQAILFSIMSFIFFLLARNENNKFLDNENFRYSFSRKIFYYYFFLSSFFIFNKADYQALFGTSSDSFHKAILGVLVFLVITSISCFTVAYFFLNPKKNKALIKGLLDKYSNSPNLYN